MYQCECGCTVFKRTEEALIRYEVLYDCKTEKVLNREEAIKDFEIWDYGGFVDDWEKEYKFVCSNCGREYTYEELPVVSVKSVMEVYRG